MSKQTAERYREETLATAAYCHEHLAGLRKEVRAAYVRQLAAIYATDAWLSFSIPALWLRVGPVYYSLGALMLFFTFGMRKERRMRHLERILAFCSAA